MTLQSFERTLKQTVVFSLLLLCAVVLALQPAFAYRIAENTGAVPTPASYSTGLAASNTKNIVSRSGAPLTATLAISSVDYSIGGFGGCGGFFQPQCPAKLQLSNNDVLGARESGASNGATSTLFTPNIPINNTRTASATNASAWRVLHNLTNCNGTISNQCDGLGTVTLTFSRPVLNPVIHLSELGGLEGTEGAPTGTVHSRLTIDQVNGGAASAASLSLLSGTNLALNGTNRIQAADVRAGTNISCVTGSPTQNTGCGSVRINGTITSIRFAASLYINRISANVSSTVGDGYSLGVTVDEDFGDAPASYDADATNGAASHVIGDLRLGASVDRDNINTLNYTAPVVQPSPNAGGNDADDNGVVLPLINGISIGASYSATATVAPHSSAARVCGWIDFNTNGTYETGERTCVNSAANTASDTVTLTWTVPTGANLTTGNRNVRVRTSYDTIGVESPTGRLDSGEVEDHALTVASALSNPPLACQSNLYTLQGDTTNGFRNIRTLQPNGTLGTIVTTVPASGLAPNPNDFNAGMAITPDGSKVFVNTPSGLMRVYDVLAGTWSNGPVIAANTSMIRAAITSNGIGYASREDQLWTFQTTPPYTSSGPVTITSLNGGPPPTASNGDLFADSNGNLFLLSNPTANGTQLNLYRIAANGNSLYLGTVTAAQSGQYGGFAAIPAGIYASSAAGNVIRADLSTFTATETAAANAARGSSDLASCFYPNLNPVIQALKTATKISGSAGTDIRPGDTVEYRIVIRNTGTIPAADVKFQDSIPTGTTYVAGSTTYNYTTATGRPQVALADVGGVMPFATARTIESPNQSSAGVLLIDSTGVGTMGLTETDRDREVVITFRVTVNADATSVTNQGVVTYIDDPGPPRTATVVTDDPATPTPNDSTTSTLLREADLAITKIGTQSANTGSIVSYVIRLTNNGPTAVNGAVINDTLPAGLSNAYWNCVVPIDGTFATTANIGTRTDEICVNPPTSATTLLQTSSTIAQTVNLPAGRSVEIRVIGRANGAGLSNTASVTVPAGITDPNLTNNTTAAVNTSVLSALDVASCNAVKILDANGVINSAVAWPVQQGAVTPTVSFNRSGTFNINQAHTAPSVSTGTAPNPLLIGSGTDRLTKTSGTAWSWTATFSQPVPLNQLYMHLNDVNAFDPTVTLSISGGTATLANFSGYSSNQSGTAQELIFNQSNGQIIRAFNRNNGSEAADSNPRGSLVLLSNSSNTVTSITLTSNNTATGDLIGIELGARVGCDYGDAAAPAGDPRAGVLSSYLQMGATIPDVEATPATPRDLTGDDVTTRDDEDIISVTPQLNILATSFSLSGLSVLNTTEGAATLRGWIDVNGNNIVDTGELATVAVPTNAAAQTVALSWPSLPTLTAGTKLLRFTLLDDANSLFGEVEDHQLTVRAPVTYNCPTGSTATGSGFATSGTGLYRDSLFWLDWSCGAATEFAPSDTVNKSWVTPTGAVITATLNNIAGGSITPYSTGDWGGDDLPNLYGGVNPIGLRNVDGGQTPTFNIAWSASLNGITIPVDLVMADAEDLAQSSGEFTQTTTNGDAWQLLESQGAIAAQFSNAAQTLRFSNIVNDSGGVALALSENTSSTQVSVQGGGVSAIAFAVAIGNDFGDAPASFGTTGQYQELAATGSGQPATATDANSIAKASLAFTTPTWLGTLRPDVERNDQHTANATGDDVAGVDDEDGVNPATLNLTTANSSFSVNVVVNNTRNVSARLVGWIDWNNDGVFQASEAAQVVVPANSAAQTLALNWTGLTGLTTGTRLARFRMSSDAALTTATPTGGMADGEVEDYVVTVLLGQANITGRVFTDNSGTTAVAANAYNGIQNTGELGLAGSTVELNNCAGTVIATTQTDGAGDYSFGVLLNQLSTPNFCITQTNLAGYTSVSGTAGYARTTDTITIANSGALSYTGHNFGDARLNLVLTSDGQQTTTPSGTVSYPHILRSESVLSVGTLNTISTESPTFGWTTVLYRDTNCNGTVDGGESTLTSAIGQLLPNQEICVVQRVNAPANATNGAQHVATLSASYTATVQGGAVLNGSSNTRTDTTLVGTAGLDMRKQVRVVASCPSTGADNAAFVERNTAQNGDFLEYQIIYSNRSTRNLSQLTVRDVVPSSTTFQSATCQSTPSGSGCTAPVSAAANGDLAWSLTNIAPAATGSVRFCVRVPPLAEPPIQ